MITVDVILITMWPRDSRTRLASLGVKGRLMKRSNLDHTIINGNQLKGTRWEGRRWDYTGFPDHGLMDALGIVYPQYWLQGNCAASFRKHLDIIKAFYGEPRCIGKGENKRFIPAMLEKFLLESEQPLFKIAMIANAHASMELPPLHAPAHQLVNPLTKLWRTLDANSSLGKNFGEYLKLAQIAMVHVLGKIEDERTFSVLSFLKDRVHNRLDEHLGVVVGMHCQDVHSLKNFPCDDCFK